MIDVGAMQPQLGSQLVLLENSSSTVTIVRGRRTNRSFESTLITAYPRVTTTLGMSVRGCFFIIGKISLPSFLVVAYHWLVAELRCQYKADSDAGNRKLYQCIQTTTNSTNTFTTPRSMGHHGLFEARRTHPLLLGLIQDVHRKSS